MPAQTKYRSIVIQINLFIFIVSVMLVFTLLVPSRQRLSCRIGTVDCEESTYPAGLALSTAGKALIRQD